jgi:tyrosine-protein kinase Etk/Wzc
MPPTIQAAASSSNESDNLDLTAVLDILVENRLRIAIVAVLFMMIGTVYAFLSPPVYETNILVQVEDSPDSAAKSLLGDISSIFDVKSTADAEIQILGSRLVVSRAVDALKLYLTAQPKRFPMVGGWVARHAKGLSHPGLFGMGGYVWGKEAINVDTFDVPPALYEHSFKLTVLDNGLYSVEGDGLEQAVQGKVGKLEVFGTDEGPVQLLVHGIAGEPGAAFTLTRHSRLETIDGIQKRLKIESVGKDSDVISAALQSVDPDLLQRTLNEIAHQYLKQNAERKAAQAEQSLEFLTAQEPQMKHDLEASEDRYNAYRNQHSLIEVEQEAKVVLQQSSDLQTKQFELRQKRQELVTRYGPKHPAIIAIDEQLGSTQADLDQIEERIKGMPIAEQGALRLERDVRVNTDLYLALRNNIEQLRLVKAGKIGSVRLVDDAFRPELQVKPKKLLIISTATILGLIVGVGLGFLRDTLFLGVTDPHSLETRVGLDVFATIPYSEAQGELARQLHGQTGKSTLLVATRPDDPAVESLRSLRTALQFSLLEARNNIVMVTGPSPDIGKSFVSLNLAALFAASGKRALFIDADLRRGESNRYLGMSRERGVAEVLGGAIEAANALRKEVLPNLDVLPTGTLPANPAELLMNGRWQSMLTELAPQYDLVLIDAPPVLAVSDAEIMAPSAGTVFLVAMFGETRAGEIEETVKRLKLAGSLVTGLLFNGMKARGGKYAYGGKYAGYRYVSYKYEARTVK